MTYTALGKTDWFSGEYKVLWEADPQQTATGEAWNWFYFFPIANPYPYETQIATFDRVLFSCWANAEKKDVRMLVQRGEGEAAQFAIVRQSQVKVAEV